MGDDASKRLPEINAQMLAIKTVNEDIASLEADLALVTDKQATLRAKLSVLDVEEKEVFNSKRLIYVPLLLLFFFVCTNNRKVLC